MSQEMNEVEEFSENAIQDTFKPEETKEKGSTELQTTFPHFTETQSGISTPVPVPVPENKESSTAPENIAEQQTDSSEQVPQSQTPNTSNDAPTAETLQPDAATLDTPSASNTPRKAPEAMNVDWEVSQDSQSNTESTPNKERKFRKTINRIMVHSLPQGLEADSLFEYQWPRNDPHADYYILQEQISVFLDVTSFRRKYPDLTRRQIDISERNFLKELGVVTEMQCDLGLTALRSEEISDVLVKDYPHKYDEYAKVLHAREEQRLAIKQKQLHTNTLAAQQTVPSMNKTDLTRLTKRAIKSAAQFNQFLQSQRREERRYYYDITTGIIQCPQTKKRVLPPELTRPSPYPVSLVRGQFTDVYKTYTSDELSYLPVKTCLYDPPLRIDNPYVPLRPDPDELLQLEQQRQLELQKQEEQQRQLLQQQMETVRPGPPGTPQSAQPEVSTPVKHKTKVLDATCMICINTNNKQGQLEQCIKCNQCGKESHPTCNEINEEMLSTVLTYKWMCMDCKVCVRCSDPGNEDKMIVCDKCDRGYHTFCVGLEEIPDESMWVCPQCAEKK